jgi:hypothetical protein
MRSSCLHMGNSKIRMRCLDTLIELVILSFETTWTPIIQTWDPNSMALAKVVHMNDLTPCDIVLDLVFPHLVPHPPIMFPF